GVDHCWVEISKMFRLVEFMRTAAIERPSGDQRGENMPTDPGTVETFLLSRSTMLMTLFGSAPPPGLVEKTTLRPSGDQLGSVSNPLSSGKSLCGLPPADDTM